MSGHKYGKEYPNPVQPSRTHCSLAATQNDRISGAPKYPPRGYEGQQREGQAVTATQGSGGGSRTDVCDTPNRRPRPPVDAWGTPPSSSDKNMGDGRGVAGTGGGVTGGLLPSLTGKESSWGTEAARKVRQEGGTKMQIRTLEVWQRTLCLGNTLYRPCPRVVGGPPWG